MRPRFARIVIVFLLLPLAAAANDLAAMGASARSHACCAKTKYACAGLKSADDCCKRMGHTAGQAAPGTITAGPSFDSHATAETAIAHTAILAETQLHEVSSHAFKRPHDPPHLHAFTLLI